MKVRNHRRNRTFRLPRETEPLWGTSGKEWPELRRLAKVLRRMDERKRKLLLGLAQGMARRKHAK